MKKISRQRRAVEQRAAEHRSEGGREQHRHADERHHPPHPLRPGGAREDRHPDRHHHARRRGPAATRKAISDPADHASPHSSEPTRKAVTATMNTRRVPKRSTAQPASGITAASASR